MENSSSNYFSNLLNRLQGDDKTTTINLFIRGLTLGGKFFLQVFLADKLTESQLGEWSIFTASVALSLYLVGLDFYTYSTRKILEYPLEERGRFLRDQFVLYGIGYLILFPLLSLLFAFHVMELKLAIFFYIILVFEHLAAESFRIFVALSQPIAANIILFLRTGLWSYLLALAWFFNIEQFQNLKSTFLFWIGGGALALLVTIIILIRLPFKKIRGIPVDWDWIKKGIKVSMVFFVGTISFKIIELSDRYFIAFYRAKEDVGVYNFFASMSNMIEIFVQTTVIILFSPRLIDAFHKNNFQYRKTLALFAKRLFKMNIAALFLLAALMYPILTIIINKQIYYDNILTLVLLTIAEIAYNFSLIFHYILYVRKNDTSIVKSTIFTAVINILLNFILIPSYGMEGAALATLISFIILILAKAYYTRMLPEGKQIIYLRFLYKKSGTKK